ncbi:DUF1127 domain-containing protein [Epibacterium ulvae]|uniref:DUF1127 domain-containing protein n=1 Tax=Epibacterium ulvae TaxID=1156985 RepID=UPI001BFC2106|nr:DUF1127 domain-containing protein [Epibacterium ulvae]MBT8155931.1 DUF1127 domain-containing protein [Epibacterium ulvae]
MTTAIFNANTAAPVSRFQAVADQISAFIAKRRIYNEVRRELQSLTNRELDDIGIRRSDVTAIAREHAALKG